MHATGVVMIQDNKNIIERLESYLSNPLQPFDYSLLQEAYNEIIALRTTKDNLYTTINLVGDLNIKFENQYFEAQNEIERLRTIIYNYYYEERKYQDQINDRVDPEFTIPQSWKDAYRAFEEEAYAIELGF